MKTGLIQRFICNLALVGVMFFAFAAFDGAEAASCGGENQKACPILKEGPVCDPGLGSFNKVCKRCGGKNERACPISTPGPRCRGDLDRQNGKCVSCGGLNEPACGWEEKGRRCDVGLGKFDGVCKRCGKDNQPACPAMEQGAPCETGLRKVDGRCVACGGLGQRICRIVDKGPACKDGLEINFLTQKCQKEEPSIRERTFQQYQDNKTDFDRRHARLTRALASVTEGGAPGEIPPGPDDSAAVDVVDGLFIGADDGARREMMMRYLEHDDVEVVTLMTGGGGSAVVGYARATGWAMKARGGGQPFGSENPSDFECRAITTNMFTAGLSAGISGTVEIGEWDGGFDAVNGKSHGVQAMASVLAAGWGAGAHFGRDGGAWGGTVINGGAVGAELTPIEYVHSWTDVEDEETDCADITW